MKLLKITSQIRRDFRGTFECESCGNVEKDVSGYDDTYYHTKVIPDMKCSKCGESSTSLGIKNTAQQPKYPENLQV